MPHAAQVGSSAFHDRCPDHARGLWLPCCLEGPARSMSGTLYGELKPLGISVTVIEPRAFGADFAGRSLAQSSTVIDGYAETAGNRRKEHDTAHGTQPGDPAKAADAIIPAVESDESPCVPAGRSTMR